MQIAAVLGSALLLSLGAIAFAYTQDAEAPRMKLVNQKLTGNSTNYNYRTSIAVSDNRGLAKLQDNWGISEIVVRHVAESMIQAVALAVHCRFNL